jgi:hypothetical protein
MNSEMNFCTLFDSNYLSRGLVLYDSLCKTTKDFQLYVFAFDNLALNILNALNLENVTVISLKEFENENLLSVKESRTRAEYCWTSTSSVIKYVLDNYNVSSCTYIDADLYFYNSPEVLLNEMPEDKSVLITEHRYSWFSRIYEMKRAGRFCVQFITFRNTPDSIAVLDKWISQCIDWCYSRYEDGKFGDQKYLDDWPEVYRNIYILKHNGGGIAPWNADQFDFRFRNGNITGYDNKNRQEFDIIFFHFHFVRITDKGLADIGWNRLKANVVNGFYKPYIGRLLEKEVFLRNKFHDYNQVFSNMQPHGIKEYLKYFLKITTGFNLVKTT